MKISSKIKTSAILLCLAVSALIPFNTNLKDNDTSTFGSVSWAQGLTRSQIRERFERERAEIRRGPQEVKRLMRQILDDVKKEI